MQLEHWRKEKGLPQSGLGELLLPPVTQGLVSQWETGQVRITLDYALQITEVTKGKVTPQECADMFHHSTHEKTN